MNNASNLGYIKYKGAMVEHGTIDARSAAEALAGVDKAVRYFLSKQQPGVIANEIPIPIQTSKGSWQIIIPADIEAWFITMMGIGASVFAGAYAKKAAERMAENDFKDLGMRDLLLKSLIGIQWVIRIGKHLGTVTKKKLHGIRWRNENTEVGIINDAGIYLYVPFEYFTFFIESPNSLLRQLAGVVEKDRTLIIGQEASTGPVEESISVQEKEIFGASDEIEPVVIFPKLSHGQSVVLEGIVTRGNETSNTIGFRYENYILTCWPEHGSVKDFKPCLFLNCRISGTINREDDKGNVADENPPHIVFSSLVPLEEDKAQAELPLPS